MAEAAGRPTRGYGLLEGFLARRRAHLADRFIPAAARSGRILDVGCGSDPLFLRSVDFAEKHGVDQVASPSTADGIELRGFDADREQRLPYPDGHFSVVTMLAVIEHVDRDRLVPLLAEIRRVLAPGGRFIATTPAWWTDGLLRLLGRLHLVSPEEIDEHQGMYRLEELHDRLAAAGFERDRIRGGHFELFMNSWVTADR